MGQKERLCTIWPTKNYSSKGKRRYVCNLKEKDLYGCDHKVNSHCTGVPQIQQNGRQKWSRQKVQTKMRNFRIVWVSKTLVWHLRKFDYQASVYRSSHIVWGENVISRLKLQSGSTSYTYNPPKFMLSVSNDRIIISLPGSFGVLLVCWLQQESSYFSPALIFSIHKP